MGGCETVAWTWDGEQGGANLHGKPRVEESGGWVLMEVDNRLGAV
jgi:hypothetical protein